MEEVRYKIEPHNIIVSDHVNGILYVNGKQLIGYDVEEYCVAKVYRPGIEFPEHATKILCGYAYELCEPTDVLPVLKILLDQYSSASFSSEHKKQLQIFVNANPALAEDPVIRKLKYYLPEELIPTESLDVEIVINERPVSVEERRSQELLAFISTIEALKKGPRGLKAVGEEINRVVPFTETEKKKLNILELAIINSSINFNAPLVAQLVIRQLEEKRFYDKVFLETLCLLSKPLEQCSEEELQAIELSYRVKEAELFPSLQKRLEVLKQLEQFREDRAEMVHQMAQRAVSFDFGEQYQFVRIPAEKTTLFMALDKKALLGSGASGAVYTGYFVNPKTGVFSHSKYAVKVLKDETSESVIQEEVRGIKKLFGTALSFQTAGQHYIVTDYVEGSDLADETFTYANDRQAMLPPQQREIATHTLISTQGVSDLNLVERLKAIVLMANQLNKMHHYTLAGAPRLHGDIKSQNIRRHIQEGKVADIQLVDFNFSTEVSGEVEFVEKQSGSYGYFPPEIYESKSGLKSDIFSWTPIVMLLLGAQNPVNPRVIGHDDPKIKFDRTGLFQNIKNALGHDVVIAELIQGLVNRFLDKMEEHDYTKRKNSDEALRFFTAWYQYEQCSAEDKETHLKIMQCLVDPEIILREENFEQKFNNFSAELKSTLFEYVSKEKSDIANEKRDLVFTKVAEVVQNDVNAFSGKQTLSIVRRLMEQDNVTNEVKDNVKNKVADRVIQNHQNLFYFNAKRRASRELAKAIRGQTSLFFKPKKYLDDVLAGKTSKALSEVVEHIDVDLSAREKQQTQILARCKKAASAA